MKTSLRVVAALGLWCLLTVPALAAPQGAPPAAQMGGMRRGGMGRMGRMMKDLGLTAAQKAKMKTIMEAQRPQMMALRNNQSLTEDQRRAKMKAMGEARNKKIAAILTPAQRQKMATLMKERRGGRGGQPGGPRAAKA